jgi:transcriptional regulator with XRE-family HTH domain
MIVSKSEFTVIVGANVRSYRLKANLTIEQLAFDAGLTYSQVSRIELGKIKTSAYTLYVLAKHLKVTPNELLVVQISQ